LQTGWQYLFWPGTCGRVHVKTSLDGVLNAFSIAQRGDIEGIANAFPRWNGAPKQDYPIIIQEPDVAGPVFMRANWGLIPAARRTRRSCLC
jgi:hypothetical protein